jgi:hypothetical protein
MPFCQGSTPDLSDTTDLLTCVAEATDIMEKIVEKWIILRDQE